MGRVNEINSGIEFVGTEVLRGHSASYGYSANFPNAENVQKYAFAESGLESITLPAATSIYEGAFKDCTKLNNVSLPGCIALSLGAFENCTGLTSIELPLCRYIKESVFKNNTSLTSAELPGLEELYKYAFENCTNLTNINLGIVKYIESDAFNGCSSLESVSIRDGAWRNGVTLNSLITKGFESAGIPSSLHTVTVLNTPYAAGFLKDCSWLTTINLPEDTTDLPGQYFSNCTGLTTINIPNLTTISGYAVFAGCTSLTNVSLPNLTTINKISTFLGCTALTNISLPNLVSVSANHTFADCNHLKEVNLPNLESLEGCNGMFQECWELETIDFPKLKHIGSNIFHRCHSLKAVILRSETKCDASNVVMPENIGIASVDSFLYHFFGYYNPTYNPNSEKDGYIYVPAALIEEYQNDLNWHSVITQFRALEDYTVDGTITGALDPNKI